VFPKGVTIGGPGVRIIIVAVFVMLGGVLWWFFVPDGDPAQASQVTTTGASSPGEGDEGAAWLASDHGSARHFTRRRHGGDGDYTLPGEDASTSDPSATPPPSRNELPPRTEPAKGPTTTTTPATPFPVTSAPATCAGGGVPDFGGNCGPPATAAPTVASVVGQAIGAGSGAGDLARGDGSLVVAVADATSAPSASTVAASDGTTGSGADKSGVYRRVPATTPYVLQRGEGISATLSDQLDSEFGSNTISARVRADVCDSVTGSYELIPQNSRLVGIYSNVVAQGQTRLAVSWLRVYFPDGSHTDFPPSPAADVNGMPGLGGKVDNHTGSILFATLLGSILTAGAQIAATPPGANTAGGTGAVANPTLGQSAASGAGSAIGQTAAKIVDRQLNVPPTIYVRRGEPFLVKVTDDVHFDAPWGLCAAK